EFKGLLENNLKSIEEIKLMIDTLSHIETKPLFPGEFKQTYPETKPAAVSWVGIGAIAQAKPLSPSQPQWPPVQSPAQSVLSTPSSVVEANPEPTSPAPALPQSNGTGSPTPETTNAPSTTPLDALAASTAPVTAPVVSSDTASSSTLDESFNIAPSQDDAEDVADALVVKVEEERANWALPVPGLQSQVQRSSHTRDTLNNRSENSSQSPLFFLSVTLFLSLESQSLKTLRSLPCA